MRVLVVTHRFPYPPNRGDRIRSWGEVAHLARRHEVWLACVDREAPTPEDLAHVRARCREVAVFVRSHQRSLARGAARLLAGASINEGYFYDPRLAAVLADWGRALRFDALLTFSPAMSVYADLVPATRRVLDMNDVESEKWGCFARRSLPPLRWLYGLEARRLPRAEAAWIRAHDVTVLVNASERQKLPTALRAQARVVRTGVDLTPYADARPGDLPRAPVVGIVGSMSYAPNVRAVNWFGRQVWPRVKQVVPGARWLIVGSRPVASVRRWARDPAVCVTGSVPDILPYWRQMRVFACPAREQIGVQTKLIEALAAARAIVVSPPAAAGIDYDDPPPFLVAGSAAGFAGDVVRLLRDDAPARALAVRARAVAVQNYRAEDTLLQLEALLAQAPGAARVETVARVSAAHQVCGLSEALLS
jgi:sugar transferase (PEP-CTERM/EpsH1 system associated)